MKIDFSQTFTDLDGTPIQADAQSLTLGMVAVQALMAQFPDEKELDGAEKLRRYKLALAIHGACAPLDVVVEDIASLKKLIGKAYGVLVVGQALPMLETAA